MTTVDNQRRVKIPNGLASLSIGMRPQKIVLIEAGEKVFQVIPLESGVPSGAKIVAGPLKMDPKLRLIIPKYMFRDPVENHKSVEVKLYVRDSKLYLEF